MQTKVTLILDNPADAVAFEADYPALADRAAALPGLVRLESAKVFPKEDGTAPRSTARSTCISMTTQPLRELPPDRKPETSSANLVP